MIRFFNKVFNIRTEEWSCTLLLFFVAVLSSAGFFWGLTITYAAFLQTQGGGLEALPWVLVLISIFSIIAIAIYTPFVDRVTDDKLMNTIFAIECSGIILGLVLLQLGYSSFAYSFLYLLGSALLSVINPHQTTYFNNFYDIRAAKRTLPVINAGYRTGSVVAGLSMPFLNSWFANPRTIIVIWLMTHIAMMGLVWFLPYLLKKDRTQDKQVHNLPTINRGKEKQQSSYFESVREGFHYTTQSTYLRWLAVGTLVLMILMALLEFKSTELLLEKYDTTTKLADFLALLRGVSNFFVVLILLFGMNRLIVRLGLGNTSLIFPVGSLFVCASLFVRPGWLTASAAYLARTDFRLAFQFPIEGLLYNAISYRVKGRARTFVSGLLAPVGSLIGGLLLLSFAIYIPMAWLIFTLIGILAATYMINAIVIRQQYSQALIKMLEQEDYSFLFSQEVSDLTVTDPALLTWLRKKLEESTSRDFTVFMAQLISQVGGNEAIPILGQAARTATDTRTRAAIIDVLVAADMHDDAVRRLYSDFLADSDGQVRQSAFAGLEQLSGPGDKQFQTLALSMLTDPDIEVRVRVLSALARNDDFYSLLPAVEILNQLLNDSEPQRRIQGVRVLGKTCTGGDAAAALQRLVEYLSDPADGVRLEAALVIETLSAIEPTKHSFLNLHTTLIVDRMSDLLQDPVERVRQAAIIVLGHIAGRAGHKPLAGALTDISPQVRTTAVDTLVQLGRAIIPLIHPLLNSPNPQLRKMAAVVLSRINPREFGALIGKHITENLLVIYRNYGYLEALALCTGYQSIPILQSILREQNQQLVDEIFYLLTAIHGSSDVKIITASLQSEDSRIRANAIEALESLTTPQTTRLIAPLFEPEPPFPQLIALSKDIWDMEQPTTIQAFQQLVTEHDDPWVRRLTIFVLGEISAVLISKIKQSFTKPFANNDRRANSPHDVNESSHSGQENSVETAQFPSDTQALFTLPEMESLVDTCLTTGVTDEVQQVVHAARQMMMLGAPCAYPKEKIMLSTIEKMIFLKEVPFFKGMTVEQLKILANVCEEKLFEEDTRIFNVGDPGGILYVVVNGRVGIEQEKRRGSFVRVNTIEPRSSFGEITLFDGSPRTASAIAIRDTLILQLRREPLIALARQYPELSLELINVLSNQLREAYDRTAKLTRSRPRELQKLFDQFD